MKTVTATTTIQNKKHTYTLTQKKGGVVHMTCEAACIDQDFLAEDIGALLIDLPNLIIAEKEHSAKQTDIMRFRVSSSDKSIIEKKAVAAGFSSVSDYLRHLALA